MNDPNDKTPRHLYIRNYLFVIFEEMARDIGCSVDYLVNEAMRTYARSHRPSKALDTPSPKSDFTPAKSSSSHTLTEGTLPIQNGMPQLYLWFNGKRHTIEKTRYLIGRGGPSKSVDLIIADGNISRRHCVITYLNGEYIIKDLNSTNGIEYEGENIQHKRIEEGDGFYLCDYHIRFTFDTNRVY